MYVYVLRSSRTSCLCLPDGTHHPQKHPSVEGGCLVLARGAGMKFLLLCVCLLPETAYVCMCCALCVCVQGWEYNEKTHLLKYRFKKVVGESLD